MRYPASEKVEIIRLVEASPLPARRTLEKLGIARATFYRWYDRDSGPEALGDRCSRPDRVGNRICPRAVSFADHRRHGVQFGGAIVLPEAHDDRRGDRLDKLAIADAVDARPADRGGDDADPLPRCDQPNRDLQLADLMGDRGG